jgi:hypothetical protein
MAGFAVSRNGGGGGGGFVGPRRVSAPVRVVSAPRTVTSSRPITVTPRGQDFVSHYDPSRVLDIDNLKVVADMRQSGAERGEKQSGDDGVLSPSESRSGTVTAPGGKPGAPGAPGAFADNKMIPVALAIAAFVLLGG